MRVQTTCIVDLLQFFYLTVSSISFRIYLSIQIRFALCLIPLHEFLISIELALFKNRKCFQISEIMHVMHFAVSRIEWKTQKLHNNISNSKDLLYLPRWIFQPININFFIEPYFFALFWINLSNEHTWLPTATCGKQRLETKSKLRSKQKRRLHSVDNSNFIEIKRNAPTLVAVKSKNKPAEIKHKPIGGYRSKIIRKMHIIWSNMNLW